MHAENEPHTETWCEQLFEQPEPTVPSVRAPSLQQLRQRGRDNRRWRRGTVALLMLGLVLASTSWFRNSRSSPADRSPSLSVLEIASTETPAGVNANRHPEAAASASEAASTADVHVFATVRNPVPIFDRPQGTPYYRHVGWIDSEAVVPVDVSRIPEDQLRRLEAVLHDDFQSPRSYNL